MTSPAKRGVVLEERRVRAVLRRYLAGALVERALDELRDASSEAPPVDVPPTLPAIAPPTELELQRVERIARRRGMVVVTRGRSR